MTIFQQIVTITMVILGTLITRFVPFLLFPSEETTPTYILYLGKVLTPAIFGLLVIFSLKDTQLTVVSDVVPKLVSVLLVILLHKWKKNMLLSITGGTLFYIAIIHLNIL